MSDAHAGTAANHSAGGHDPAADHDVHADDHDALTLGVPDWGMWLAGVVGVAFGLAIVFAFVLAGQGMPAV